MLGQKSILGNVSITSTESSDSTVYDFSWLEIYTFYATTYM